MYIRQCCHCKKYLGIKAIWSCRSFKAFLKGLFIMQGIIHGYCRFCERNVFVR